MSVQKTLTNAAASAGGLIDKGINKLPQNPMMRIAIIALSLTAIVAAIGAALYKLATKVIKHYENKAVEDAKAKDADAAQKQADQIKELQEKLKAAEAKANQQSSNNAEKQQHGTTPTESEPTPAVVAQEDGNEPAPAVVAQEGDDKPTPTVVAQEGDDEPTSTPAVVVQEGDDEPASAVVVQEGDDEPVPAASAAPVIATPVLEHQGEVAPTVGQQIADLQEKKAAVQPGTPNRKRIIAEFNKQIATLRAQQKAQH